MGRSETRTDFFGDEYTVHLNDDGEEIGRSEEKTDFFGNHYTQHNDKDGNKTGHSEEKTDFFGDAYTQHYEGESNKTGRSEERTDFFGDPYTQHFNRDGDKAGHSEPKTDFFGDRYTAHFSSSGESTRDQSGARHTKPPSPTADRTTSDDARPGVQASGGGGSSGGGGGGSGAAPGLIALIVGLGVLAFWSDSRESQKQSDEVRSPPEQFIDREACLGEECRYGERWFARQDTVVFAEPPEVIGTSATALQRKTVIRAGNWATTKKGIRLEKRRTGLVDGKVEYGDSPTNAPQLRIGQEISLYVTGGDGCFRSWVDGRFLFICRGIKAQEDGVWETWVQVETENRLVGWVKHPNPSFVSQTQLQVELASKIADSQLSLPAKLAQIDILLKEGAQLNGPDIRHLTRPFEAATSTLDVVLLKALMSRGLQLQNGQHCEFSTIDRTALEPGGDVMLDFLLGSGMPLSCLNSYAGLRPPLRAILNTGIDRADYSVDRAIRVAEVLVRYGAKVHQQDSDGKSIFDVLEQRIPTNPALTKLRDALTEMGNGIGQGQSDGLVPGGGGSSGGAYRVGGDVSAPSVLTRVEPEYSEEARNAKWQGTVVLWLVVDDQGRPQNLEIVRSPGLGLDQKALEAVEKWRFLPGMKGDKPVPVMATIEVSFRLL